MYAHVDKELYIHDTKSCGISTQTICHAFCAVLTRVRGVFQRRGGLTSFAMDARLRRKTSYGCGVATGMGALTVGGDGAGTAGRRGDGPGGGQRFLHECAEAAGLLQHVHLGLLQLQLGREHIEG